jgi:hypothetical protein
LDLLTATNVPCPIFVAYTFANFFLGIRIALLKDFLATRAAFFPASAFLAIFLFTSYLRFHAIHLIGVLMFVKHMDL